MLLVFSEVFNLFNLLFWSKGIELMVFCTWNDTWAWTLLRLWRSWSSSSNYNSYLINISLWMWFLFLFCSSEKDNSLIFIFSNYFFTDRYIWNWACACRVNQYERHQGVGVFKVWQWWVIRKKRKVFWTNEGIKRGDYHKDIEIILGCESRRETIN